MFACLVGVLKHQLDLLVGVIMNPTTTRIHKTHSIITQIKLPHTHTVSPLQTGCTTTMRVCVTLLRAES